MVKSIKIASFPIDFGAMQAGNGAGELSYRVCEMANKEQLAILKQGVAAWNKWREENPDAKIDLSGESFEDINMSGINLSNADIRGAIFLKCKLERSNFRNADARSSKRYSTATNFHCSDLTCSTFENAIFSTTILSDTILNGTSIMGVKEVNEDDPFIEFELPDFFNCYENTILADSNVRKLLMHGSAQGLSLERKNLQGAYLVKFDLRNTDLRGTDLRQADLSRADITGAKLYNSARENWIIDDIRCEHVYWDEAGKQRTPPDRDFRPGEFEELYKQLPTFEYVFANGFTPLDPLIMDRVVQAVNEQHKEFSLELVNFDKRGQPHATFTVCHLEHVEKAKQQIAAGYEESRIAPEQQAQLMAAVLGLIENQNKLIDKIPSSRGLAMGDTYNIHGGQIGAVGQSASASGNTFQQITADLSRLHEEMQRSAKTPEQRAAAEDVAKATQAAREQNEPAMRQHLKNAGKFVLDCTQKIGVEALAEYLKKMTLGM